MKVLIHSRYLEVEWWHLDLRLLERFCPSSTVSSLMKISGSFHLKLYFFGHFLSLFLYKKLNDICFKELLQIFTGLMCLLHSSCYSRCHRGLMVFHSLAQLSCFFILGRSFNTWTVFGTETCHMTSMNLRLFLFMKAWLSVVEEVDRMAAFVVPHNHCPIGDAFTHLRVGPVMWA